MAKDNKNTGFARPSRAAKDKVLATAKEAMKFSETDDKAIQMVSPKVEEEIAVAENVTPALVIVEAPPTNDVEDNFVENSTNQESEVGGGGKQVQLVGKKVIKASAGLVLGRADAIVSNAGRALSSPSSK